MMVNKYYSVLVDWGDDTNAFGWSGFATDLDNAVLQTRQEMASEDLRIPVEELSISDCEQTGGHVIEVVEGASMWCAGTAAHYLENLLSKGDGITRENLVYALELLRPYQDERPEDSTATSI